MAQELFVWVNGVLVGQWSRSQNGVSVFEYDRHWAQAPNAFPLSVSLPIPIAGGAIRGDAVRNYFDNLLPDAQTIRDRIRKKFRTRNTEAYELLQAIGRDCIGAVQLLPPGETPIGFDTIDSEPMTPEQVDAAITASLMGIVPAHIPDEMPFRISLAGAQEKIALLKYKGEWHLPKGATPTSHILKLPMGLIGGQGGIDLRESVENEWLCTKLLGAIGFKVPDTSMEQIGPRKVLVVERFDRLWIGDGEWLARLPQEDFCQVFGLPSNKKYESDGGPGMQAILSALEGSQERDNDRHTFLLANFVFWLLAALDGHAKNFSISLLSDGAYRMTPLYDVLSFWPFIGAGPGKTSKKKASMAMGVQSKNMHRKLDDIQARHWKAMADKAGLPEAFGVMRQICEQIDTVFALVEAVLTPDFPRHLFETIRAGTCAQARLFLRQTKMLIEEWNT
jgi:serine/threonine-protein kinase HipA